MQPLALTARRIHLTRLMRIWRSAGWPCRDTIELDLLAARWIETERAETGHETLRLTAAGLEQLATARQANQRSVSLHDRLAERVALHLVASGRVVWRELSLRAAVTAHDAAADGAGSSWRIARPDVFSVRNTSVESYLHPMVHEVKASRADLLSDLRHAAKRESYRWLSCETCYVFPAGIAAPDEIPEAFGIWTWHGGLDDGRLEFVRPARHTPCTLPFAIWLALAKATPYPGSAEEAQAPL